MDVDQIVEIRSRRNGEQHRSPVKRTQRRRDAVGRRFQRAVKRGVGGHVDENLARVQIELPGLGIDDNGLGDLVRRTRAALDEMAFKLGGGTGR